MLKLDPDKRCTAGMVSRSHRPRRLLPHGVNEFPSLNIFLCAPFDALAGAETLLFR